MKTIMITLGLTLLVTQANAAQRTGNDLYEGCKALAEGRANAPDVHVLALAGQCAGQLEAVSGLASQSWPQRALCVPPNVTDGQGARVVMSWMQRHPEETHHEFWYIAYAALYEVWSCSK